MKWFFKIALALVAVGGVTYWLLSKCAAPARLWRERWTSRRQEED